MSHTCRRSIELLRSQRRHMARVAPFALLLPVFALISSVLFLGDPTTPTLIVGGLLAISGVAITQVRSIMRPNLT